MNQVVRHAGMFGLNRQNLLQNPGRFFLIRISLVRRLRSSQQRQRIEDGRLVITWIAKIKLLHGLFVTEGASTVIYLVYIRVERLEGRNVIPLSLRARAYRAGSLHGGQAVT